MVFSVVMYRYESWITKKAEHWRTDAFELRCWRISWGSLGQQSNQSILKEVRPDIFIGGTEARAGAPILWPPDAKNWLIGKDPNAGKDRRLEKKGTRKDEMVGWYHQFIGHKLGQSLEDGERQRSLWCCSPWGFEESDMTWVTGQQQHLACSVSLRILSHKDKSFPMCSLKINDSYLSLPTLTWNAGAASLWDNVVNSKVMFSYKTP